jgi:hypothetical protein
MARRLTAWRVFIAGATALTGAKVGQAAMKRLDIT